MRWKRCFLWSLALAVVAACLTIPAALYVAPKRIRANKETCDRIQPGMTMEEVEGLIGGPPGDYTTGLWVRPIPVIGRFGHRVEQWTSDGGEIIVLFDRKGEVEKAFFDESSKTGEPVLFGRVLSYIKP
jgi:hypothetical protein